MQVAFLIIAHASELLDAPSRDLLQQTTAARATQTPKPGSTQRPNNKRVATATTPASTVKNAGRHLLEAEATRELLQSNTKAVPAKASAPKTASKPAPKTTTVDTKKTNGRHLLEATRELQQAVTTKATTAKPAAPKPTATTATKTVKPSSTPKAPATATAGRHLLEATRELQQAVSTKATSAKPAAPKPTASTTTKTVKPSSTPKAPATATAGRHLLEATRELQQATTKVVPAKASRAKATPAKLTPAASTKKTSTTATPGRHLLATQAFKAPNTPVKASTPKVQDSAGKQMGTRGLL